MYIIQCGRVVIYPQSTWKNDESNKCLLRPQFFYMKNYFLIWHDILSKIFLCPVGLSTFHPLLRVIHSILLSFLSPILYNYPFYIIVELLGSTFPMILLLCCESFLPNVWLHSASSSTFPHWDMITPSHYPCKYPKFFFGPYLILEAWKVNILLELHSLFCC